MILIFILIAIAYGIYVYKINKHIQESDILSHCPSNFLIEWYENKKSGQRNDLMIIVLIAFLCYMLSVSIMTSAAIKLMNMYIFGNIKFVEQFVPAIVGFYLGSWIWFHDDKNYKQTFNFYSNLLIFDVITMMSYIVAGIIN